MTNGWARKFGGIACVLAGALPPYLFYAWHESVDSLSCLLLFEITIAASIISFVAFSSAYWVLGLRKGQFIFGYAATYVIFISVYFLAPGFGHFGERVMWFPLALLFAVFSFTPTYAAAWFGSILVFGCEDDLRVIWRTLQQIRIERQKN